MMQNTFLILLSLMMILFILSKMLKKKMHNQESMSPFECGFNPAHISRMGFSLRFFFLTILFLVFDIEVTILLPLNLSYPEMTFLTTSISHMFLWVCLLFSTIMEWKQGALNWT